MSSIFKATTVKIIKLACDIVTRRRYHLNGALCSHCIAARAPLNTIIYTHGYGLIGKYFIEVLHCSFVVSFFTRLLFSFSLSLAIFFVFFLVFSISLI